jgi:hypothetical protein
MPKLIVTSRYLKNEKSKSIKNYVKYIATREGVSIPTADNSIYIRYLNGRPQSHGLFTADNNAIVLEKIANEVGTHQGVVWTHVVSLKREDAEKMGYNTFDMWRELVKRQINNIAEAQKISLENLKWYAAFHDKQGNPHVHIVVYSSDIKEGFLTNKGIEKIRSGFANDIYKDELNHIYQKQTQTRDLIKVKSREKMRELLKQIADGNAPTELLKLMLTLKKQLQNVKGKKVYGYLPKNVKDTVNSIVKLICDDKHISEMYDLWCELEQKKYATYTNARKEIPPLDEQQAFKSIKNDIIKQIDEMEFDTDLLETVAEDMTENKSTNNSNYKSRKNLNNDAQLVRTAMSLLNNFAKIISDDYERKVQNRIQIDSKLKRAILRKKQALGMKDEQTMEQSY